MAAKNNKRKSNNTKHRENLRQQRINKIKREIEGGAFAETKDYTTIEITSSTTEEISKAYIDNINDKRKYVIKEPLFAQYKIVVEGGQIVWAVNWITDTKYIVSIFVNNELFSRVTVDLGENALEFEKIGRNSKNTLCLRKVNFLEEKKFNPDWSQCVEASMTSITAITYFMLHYNEEVEYEIVEKEAKGVSKAPKPNSNTSNDSSKSNYAVLTLKSKRKKYVLTGDIVKKARKPYTKRTDSWNVRGYYQHFGKDKVLKYIPPRVNRRKDAKNGVITPKNYIIKGDNE